MAEKTITLRALFAAILLCCVAPFAQGEENVNYPPLLTERRRS